MGNLPLCFGSATIGHSYTLQIHEVFTWGDIGTCNFIRATSSLVEVKGTVNTKWYSGPFDIIVTDGSNGQPILIVNGVPDDCAKLNGCQVQACKLLDGYAFTFSPDGNDTIIETPALLPNVKIAF
ncbi:MAG TPA: hypothetical protein VL442_02470 [Mucilaginibacter sp.]|jgi:hypothetical protein|nr:hypothetical protein [Mucilaginibacter sp.]